MFFKLSLFLLLSCTLFATEYLQSNYFVEDDFVMLSDIVSNPAQDRKLFDIDRNRHTKRVKEKELLQTLQEYGYTDYRAKHPYVQFSKKSPINTNKIQTYIENLYKKKYSSIDIKEISVQSRSYIEKLPTYYEVGSDRKAHLDNNGIIFIKTIKNKKIFFNYQIRAEITVYVPTQELRRGTELSVLNSKKKSIMLDKFRAMPLQNIEPHTLETKHRVKVGRVFTHRDVVGLYLIKRGSKINVTLEDGRISISFSAEASQSGRLGSTISARKNDGKQIKVLVTGKNRAEMK